MLFANSTFSELKGLMHTGGNGQFISIYLQIPAGRTHRQVYSIHSSVNIRVLSRIVGNLLSFTCIYACLVLPMCIYIEVRGLHLPSSPGVYLLE